MASFASHTGTVLVLVERTGNRQINLFILWKLPVFMLRMPFFLLYKKEHKQQIRAKNGVISIV